MMIHINWDNVVIPAHVLYDFKKMRNMIVLKLSTKEKKLQEIVLTYTGTTWIEADGMHLRQPDLFSHILERLVSITREAERHFTT